MTELTLEELRTARIAEARRRACETGSNPMVQLANLYETNWKPPPKVDPDLLAAREWMRDSYHSASMKTGAVEGLYDKSHSVRAFLAGIKHGRGS